MNHTRPHDGPGTDALFEAVKSSPPVAVTLGALSGMTIETWLALAAQQRAAAVGRQGLARLKHAEDLHAATAACPELESK